MLTFAGNKWDRLEPATPKEQEPRPDRFLKKEGGIKYSNLAETYYISEVVLLICSKMVSNN